MVKNSKANSSDCKSPTFFTNSLTAKSISHPNLLATCIVEDNLDVKVWEIDIGQLSSVLKVDQLTATMNVWAVKGAKGS